MPILDTFILPASADALSVQNGAFFIAFVTSNDPATDESWCPDVRAALPHIRTAFSAEDAPDVALAEVGQLADWRNAKNVFRTKWNVNNVPTLVRYQLVDGSVKETGRLVEGEILDGKRLADFIAKN